MMGTRPRDRVLPTPAQLRNLADDWEAHHRAISVWGDRPYIDLADYAAVLPTLELIDQAETLERDLRRVAHILEARKGDDD
jgi:hypothetical protein